MVTLFKKLTDYNSVRFSAYRTAMKLREVQKTLFLHHLNLNVAIEAFDAHGLRGQVWSPTSTFRFTFSCRAKILLKFFYMVGIRKLEVMGPITW